MVRLDEANSMYQVVFDLKGLQYATADIPVAHELAKPLRYPLTNP